ELTHRLYQIRTASHSMDDHRECDFAIRNRGAIKERPVDLAGREAAHVARDADHFVGLRIAVRKTPPDRIGARPESIRHRLADDRQRQMALRLRLGEMAADDES